MNPSAVKFIPKNIPPELKTYPHWVCGRVDKSPVDPKTGKDAKANDASTWGEYDEAVHYFQSHKNNGIRTIGFEAGRSPFTFFDLDHCLDPETGESDLWAQEIINTIDSYTEKSPSGEGIRIVATADEEFPLVNRKRGGLGESGEGAVEIANIGKYFSIMRIPMKSATYYDSTRPPVPVQPGHLL